MPMNKKALMMMGLSTRDAGGDGLMVKEMIKRALLPETDFTVPVDDYCAFWDGMCSSPSAATEFSIKLLRELIKVCTTK